MEKNVCSSYDENNILIEESTYEANKNSIHKNSVTKYNSDGNIEEYISWNKDNLHKVGYEYKLDSMKNIIEMKRFINDEPDFILCRELNYY